MAAYKSLGGASPPAASSGGGDDGRIVLVGKVDRNDDRVNSAVIVSKEDGLIAISHDRYGKLIYSLSHIMRVAPNNNLIVKMDSLMSEIKLLRTITGC